MKKVIYSITKLGKTENKKITGVGYVTDDELITANISKNGKPYVRVFECIKDCHPVLNTTDEFKGAYYEIQEYQFEKNNSYEIREIEVNYYVWYKLVK